MNFAGPMNAALLSLSQWETGLVQSLNLPFGVSVVCVAQKPENATGVKKVPAV